jgi:8-oxo-dGTP pyrophosphatase MutT (NUDIX family)
VSDHPKSLLARLRGKAFHTYFLLTRPMTLGVRALVLDARERVFLVRHTYVPGWHLPGGGVEHGETAMAALRKELREEGNIALTGAPRPFGLYHATQWTRLLRARRPTRRRGESNAAPPRRTRRRAGIGDLVSGAPLTSGATRT